MTCRIDRLASGKRLVVFRVSGRLHAENVDTLRELLGREKSAVAIDLEAGASEISKMLIGVVTALQENSKTQPDLTNIHFGGKRKSK
jgi:hypothetical protein